MKEKWWQMIWLLGCEALNNPRVTVSRQVLTCLTCIFLTTFHTIGFGGRGERPSYTTLPLFYKKVFYDSNAWPFNHKRATFLLHQGSLSVYIIENSLIFLYLADVVWSFAFHPTFISRSLFFGYFNKNINIFVNILNLKVTMEILVWFSAFEFSFSKCWVDYDRIPFSHRWLWCVQVWRLYNFTWPRSWDNVKSDTHHIQSFQFHLVTQFSLLLN